MFQEDLDETNSEKSGWGTFLEKWPFWLADVLCLVAAVAIYRAQLGAPSLAGLVLSASLVLLGALFFCFPYVFEFLSKLQTESLERRDAMREFTEFHSAQLEQVNGQLKRLETTLKRAEADLQVAEGATEKIEVIGESLSELAKSAEKQAEEFNALGGQMSGELAERKDLTQRITRRLDEWVGATESIDALRAELAGLDRRLVESEALAVRFDDLNKKLDALRGSLASGPEEKRPRGGNRGKGESLMERALSRPEDEPTAPAVSRIIQGKAEEKAAKGAKTTEQPAEAVTGKSNSNKPLASNEGKSEPEVAKTEEGPDASEQAQETDEETDERMGAPPPPPTLFTNSDLPTSPSPGKAGKAKAGETAVLARVFIGIGNKPYLRGDLPGLSWDKGVPMDFREVGLWQWTTTAAEAAGKVRVYRNDLEPESDEFHPVKADEHLEIRPQFS